jgi:hypothetical protein
MVIMADPEAQTPFPPIRHVDRPVRRTVSDAEAQSPGSAANSRLGSAGAQLT